LCAADDVASFEDKGDCFVLNFGRILKIHVVEGI